MRLFYLLLLIATVSCTHKSTKVDKATGTELENVAVNTVIKDTSMVTFVEIKGEVGVPDIESLQIRITNQGKETVAVCDSYNISALKSSEYKLLFGKKLDAPVLIPAREERVMNINLELDKIRYSKNTTYKFSTSCKSVNGESRTMPELFFLFKTPEMWKEGNSLVMMPDTIIDH